MARDLDASTKHIEVSSPKSSYYFCRSPICVALLRRRRGRVRRPVLWLRAICLDILARARVEPSLSQHPVKILQICTRHVNCGAVADDAAKLMWRQVLERFLVETVYSGAPRGGDPTRSYLVDD